MDSTKKISRIAGLLYLILAISGIVSLIYIPSTFIVTGDATATASNVVSSEFLFRIGIFNSLVSQGIFIFLVLVLYRLFKEVNHVLALLMVTLVVASASGAFLNTFNQFAALIILSGADFLTVFEKPQLDALVHLFLQIYSYGQYALQIFWGLWLFPFGILVIKSRFFPKILGVLIIIAGVGYLLSSVTSIVFPPYKAAISPLTTLLEIGELPIIFWLLIVGAKMESNQGRIYPHP